MDIKITFYVLMIILVAKKQNKKQFNSKDIENEVGDKHLFIAAKVQTNKEVKAKINAAKSNSNSLTSFNSKTKIMTIPDVIYELVQSSSLLIKNNNVYLTVDNEKENKLFSKWLKVSGINKSIYVTDKCFVNIYIEKLKKDFNLKTLEKGKGNKVVKSKIGSTGKNSKIFYLETDDNTETLSADKIYFSFDEIYNQDFSINYDRIWDKLKHTVFIKKAIGFYGYDIVRNDFYSLSL